MEKLKLEQPKAIRIFHWTHVIILLVKIISGLFISYPSRILPFRFVRGLHFYMAYPLLFWLTARVYYGIVTGDYKNIVPTVKDFKRIPKFLKYELYLTSQKAPQAKYNVGQKIVFSSWFLVMLFQLVTGFAIYDPGISGPVDLVSGGYNYVRWYHYLAALYLATTIAIHIYLVFTSDLSKLKAIFTGYILKKQPQ